MSPANEAVAAPVGRQVVMEAPVEPVVPVDRLVVDHPVLAARRVREARPVPVARLVPLDLPVSPLLSLSFHSRWHLAWVGWSPTDTVD